MPKGVYKRSPKQLERLRKHAKEMAKNRTKRLTRSQLKMAAQILTFDVERKGAVNKAECPIHKKKNLRYLYVEDDGVYVFCELCDWHTVYRKNIWIH